MNTLTIIYNPLAGPNDIADLMQLVAQQWRAQGWVVDVQATQAVGHATELARTAASAGCRLVLAAGGDGTLGEVTNGLAGTATVMGPLPAGTANSFAKELRMPVPGVLTPQRLLEASHVLASGSVHCMDVGYTHAPQDASGAGRYWLLWSGTGADGFLVSELEPRPKWAKRIGTASYVLQGLPVIPRFSHVQARVRVDGRSFAGDYVLVLISNCRRYAGGLVTLSPDACMDDGRFEVWLFEGHGLGSVSYHAAMAWLSQHLEPPLSHQGVTKLYGRRIHIETFPPTPYQTDGEIAGLTPLTCELRPMALRLLVPSTAPRGLFRQRGERL